MNIPGITAVVKSELKNSGNHKNADFPVFSDAISNTDERIATQR